MRRRDCLFTSESVAEGHPDKICDQISDAILDVLLAKEAELQAKGYVSPSGVAASVEKVPCACETFVTTGTVIIAGEIRAEVYLDAQKIARDVIRRIDYDRAKYGFDCEICSVLNLIYEQSPDIAQGVDESFDAQHGAVDPLDLVGAGDQGIMFGYATDETDVYMPMPHYLASRLAERLTAVRKNGTLLPPIQLRRLLVRAVAQIPVKEIALRERCPERAIKYSLTRAKTRMRILLADGDRMLFPALAAVGRCLADIEKSRADALLKQLGTHSTGS